MLSYTLPWFPDHYTYPVGLNVGLLRTAFCMAVLACLETAEEERGMNLIMGMNHTKLQAAVSGNSMPEK